MTYKEWLSGNIPVQFFPATAIDAAAFKIETSFKNELTLNVYLYAKPNSGVTSQPFYIVLRPHGQGENRHWLVSALGFELDLELAPLLVVFRYDDVPA